jgi:hypothetical protein
MTSEKMGTNDTNDKQVVDEDTSPQDNGVYDDNDPSLTKDSILGSIVPPLTPPSPTTKHHSSLSSSFAAAFAPIIDMDGTTVLITKTHKVLDFHSTMLFCIGSIFYMILSTMDYTWGVYELRSLPPNIYMADDDATLYDYIATNTDHNYADDYIPNMTMNGASVSYYQIYYICGGLCFAFAGTIDMITERSLWPIFRFLAGIFAVASAIYISGNDYFLSNIFNLVSVHCYLVDSILLLRYPRCCAVYPTWVVVDGDGDGGGGGKQKYKKKYLLFGDFSYFVGSAIDVVVSVLKFFHIIVCYLCLSYNTTSSHSHIFFNCTNQTYKKKLAYLWVFYWASDWNISICVSAVIGSALWLLCSLVYMKAFFKGDFYPNPDPTVLPPVRLSSVILDSVRTKSSLSLYHHHSDIFLWYGTKLSCTSTNEVSMCDGACNKKLMIYVEGGMINCRKYNVDVD